MNTAVKGKPIITEYQDLIEYIGDALEYRKATDHGFSVYTTTKSLRKISPTLVSLIVRRKRRLTVDRADEFSKLLDLNPSERSYFRRWVNRLETGEVSEAATPDPLHLRNRKEVSPHILSDWLNVYVKDFFQIPDVRKNPDLINQLLAHLASHKRIQRSLKFLLREGHLRKTMDGSIVLEADLVVADPKISSSKIRQFHKAALTIAKQAIDFFPPTERFSNTLIVPLNEKSYLKLQELIEEFADKLKDFAAENEEPGERLYQLALNLSPIGRKTK
jgi:uncharacterized protein (TIGR02147 family)